MYIRNYNPSLVFHPRRNRKKELYLGVELEAITLKPSSLLDNDYDTFRDHMWLKEDCTIANTPLEYCDGFEIVSHPMTLGYIHGSYIWDKMLDVMNEDDGRSHDAASCGLHVHVNKDFFTDMHKIKLALFVYGNPSIMTQFSRRNSNQLNRWSKMKNIDNYSLKNLTDVDDRYCALNFCTRNTIEFRLFRGTLNRVTFFATLEFVDAACRWTKKVQMETILRPGSWKKFLKYVDKYSDIYPHIKPYLLTRDMEVV